MNSTVLLHSLYFCYQGNDLYVIFKLSMMSGLLGHAGRRNGVDLVCFAVGVLILLGGGWYVVADWMCLGIILIEVEEIGTVVFFWLGFG